MRRLTALLGGAALASLAGAMACASTGTPPGGPEDKTPPQVALTTPDSGATSVKVRSVTFEFTKVVNDRPSGATELDQLFLISPNDGDPRVWWHRSHIDVRPRKGFRPNTAYRITLLPGLADMRGNVMRESKTIVFSTGAAFPRFGILGRAFDWATERPAGGALVEAISLPDSVMYIAATDSTGQFDLGPLAAGRYLVRGLVDQNHNRIVDRLEKWDTLTVVVQDTRPTVELRLIERDTLPAIIAGVTVADSVTLHVAFDRALSPSQTFTTGAFRLVGADSTVIPVRAVFTDSAYALLLKTRSDSIAKARADSIAKADTTKKAAAAPPVVIPKRPVGPPPPRPALPAPPRALVLVTATPLTPGATYRLTATGLRNILFYTHPVSRTFTVPKKAPPADSTKAPGAKGAPSDTARRPARPPR